MLLGERAFLFHLLTLSQCIHFIITKAIELMSPSNESNYSSKILAVQKPARLTSINPFVVMMVILLIMVVLSYVVPAGEFQRVADDETGRTIVVPGTYQLIDSKPLGIFDVLIAVPAGMNNGAAIIFFIFVIGGAIRILDDLGTINAGLQALIRRFKGNEIFVIPVVMFVLGLLGAVGTLGNVVLALIPIGIVVARSLRLDPVVGMAMMYLGMYAGMNTGPLVMPTVGLAHQIGEMPIFSGAGIRSLICLATVVTTIVYVCFYARKIRNNPGLSLVVDLDLQYDFEIDLDDARPIRKRDWLILGVVIGAIVTLVFGTLMYQWGVIKISGLFFGLGIVAGIVGGFMPNQIADSFVKGMAGITGGAMITGFAYAIQYMLLQSQIMDTIVFHIVNMIAGLPVYLAAIGMFASNIILNFFVTSGSGQAVTVMPIMFPIADLVGLSRQVAVTAFQFGDGFSNGIAPTSGVIMAALSIARIPYWRWVRFYLPLMGWWSLIAIISLLLGVEYNWT